MNITKYQKGAYYLGVQVYNMLPSYIKTESDNPKKFKMVLQNFLYKHSFYSLDEYIQLQKGEIYTYELHRHMNVLTRMLLLLTYHSVLYICLSA